MSGGFDLSSVNTCQAQTHYVLSDKPMPQNQVFLWISNNESLDQMFFDTEHIRFEMTSIE